MKNTTYLTFFSDGWSKDSCLAETKYLRCYFTHKRQVGFFFYPKMNLPGILFHRVPFFAAFDCFPPASSDFASALSRTKQNNSLAGVSFELLCNSYSLSAGTKKWLPLDMLKTSSSMVTCICFGSHPTTKNISVLIETSRALNDPGGRISCPDENWSVSNHLPANGHLASGSFSPSWNKGSIVIMDFSFATDRCSSMPFRAFWTQALVWKSAASSSSSSSSSSSFFFLFFVVFLVFFRWAFFSSSHLLMSTKCRLLFAVGVLSVGSIGPTPLFLRSNSRT
mmetsp:Transcript_7073/g.11654  ORF Transcript_7073/g.11654 Transcript_7073/m.11654 type:complete len:280 (+) Transcript_7073:51-890(+)